MRIKHNVLHLSYKPNPFTAFTGNQTQPIIKFKRRNMYAILHKIILLESTAHPLPAPTTTHTSKKKIEVISAYP